MGTPAALLEPCLAAPTTGCAAAPSSQGTTTRYRFLLTSANLRLFLDVNMPSKPLGGTSRSDMQGIHAITAPGPCHIGRVSLVHQTAALNGVVKVLQEVYKFIECLHLLETGCFSMLGVA